MPHLIPIRGAVAGGGIGGDQEVQVEVIQQQLDDLAEGLNNIDPVMQQQITDRILAANARIEARAAADNQMQLLRTERESLLREVRCLFPGDLGTAARVGLEVKKSLAPLVDIFFDAFRPFLTEAYDDDVTFRDCFDIRGLNPEEQQLLRQGFELLMKESIVQGISAPQIAIRSFTQLLFDNNPARMLVSASGSIVAIILARDALRLFSSTVISVITFGNLNLEGITNLCGFVYRNCSLVNIRNLLIYLNVPPLTAQAFIAAIQNYNSEQRQYIIMSLFLFGLNAIDRVEVRNDIRGHINGIIERAQRYFGGDVPVPAAGDNNAAGLPPAPQNPVEAAAALNAAAAAAAAGAQPQNPVAPNPVPGQPLLAVFGDQGIIPFINNIFRNGWMRGLRITSSCLRDVFRIYLTRPPAGQGVAFNLSNFTGRMTRWGVAAIQDRSAVLDPAKPTKEVVRLLAAVNGLDDSSVRRPEDCEAALYEFGRNLKGISVGPNNDERAGAVKILENEPGDGTLVYLTDTAAPRCLQALRGYFRPNAALVVNVERLQKACLGMRLFVFEQGMRSNILAANLVSINAGQRPSEINDTPNAVLASESVQRMERFLIEQNDNVTKILFGRVRLLLQAFANLQSEALERFGVAIQNILPDVEAGVSPAVIFEREQIAARMPHKEHVKSAIRASILANDSLSEGQKNLILEEMMVSIDSIDFDAIQRYVFNQNPKKKIPETLLAAFNAFLNLPQRIHNAEQNAAAARAAVYSGLGRCAASLMNAAVVGSHAVFANAKKGIECVSGFFGSLFGDADVGLGRAAVQAAIPDIQQARNIVADNPGAAILADIQLAQQINQVEPGLQQSQDAGSRSRSRKRSTSRGTRRKGKRQSKKNKRQSRRNQRRVYSRKGRK